jgi:predicted esterase
MALTGGLIGPEGTPRNYPGRLDGTPVFLGSGDPDPHVPFWRVQETADVLARIEAEVEVRRFPDMGHMINEEELLVCRDLMRHLAGTAVPR